MTRHTVLAAPLALAAVLVATPVGAVNQSRDFVQNAAGQCQPALPAYEGLIRKRPLAVQNEGTASAFVTCAYVATRLATILNASTYLINQSGVPQDVTCTLVSGHAIGTVFYTTKTVSVPANAATIKGIIWGAVDIHTATFLGSLAVNCLLPPATGITTSYLNYEEDIGN